MTIWDAISNLPLPTNDGEVVGLNPISKYQRSLSNSKNMTFNHIETKHSKIAVDRMKKN